MTSSKTHKYLLIALLAAGALIYVTKGSVLGVAPYLLRYGLPLAVIYLAYRGLKSALGLSGGRREELHRQPGPEEDVIDLCPKCGGPTGPGHRCSNG